MLNGDKFQKKSLTSNLFEQKKLNEVSIFLFLVTSPLLGFERICFRNLFSFIRKNATNSFEVFIKRFAKKNSKSVFSVISLLNCFQKTAEIV